MPTRADHLRFVQVEGWVQKRSGHHVVFQLVVGDDILRTRISHPPSAKDTYGKGMWGHILKDQLKVSEEEFWACVRDRTPPARSQPVAERPGGLPAEVVYQLVERVGLPEEEVRAMTKDEAVQRLREYWLGDR